MISRFFDCLPFVLAQEGGKSDVPGDRGGRTAYGITQATFNAWTHDERDVWDISQSEVAAIYHVRYWNACQCDKMPKGLDLCAFDSAVQHGPGRAIKLLQQALGVEDDGILGSVTFGGLQARVDAGQLTSVVTSYLAARQEFYDAIIKRDKTQKKFEHGWNNRLQALRVELGISQ